ncbi:MAG: GYF domain-containing protein [Planctomycetaceae bacterium]|jgi:TM2 domain-containing membrane protein YozV|nr:GYF domain-containing protein [Planctomycetaceae bacterium]
MAYYIRIHGKAFGPFDESELQEMKSKGKLNRNSEISVNKVDWQQALEFNFLFSDPIPLMLDEPAKNFTQTSSKTSSYLPTKMTKAPTSSHSSLLPPSEPAEWFYSTNGAEGYGPVTSFAIRQMIQSGILNEESLVWQHGQNAQEIDTVPVFAEYFYSASNSSITSSHPQSSSRQFDVNLYCPACGIPVFQAAKICPKCGSPINNFKRKSRITYILLALLFFGPWGSHNFYAGRTSIAVVQLLLGISIIGLLITTLWAVLDAIIVTKDGNGVIFK